MKGMRRWVLLVPIVFGLVVACRGILHVNVLYEDAKGLKAEDFVYDNGQRIGKVLSVEPAPSARVKVRLGIGDDFRQTVTDQSRFLIADDPERPDRRAVKMVHLAKGGTPLAEGAEVEGSTPLSLQVERSGRGLQAWSAELEKQLEVWLEELNRLTEEELPKHLERQLEYWSRELEEAGEKTRRYFRQEVLPRLEETMRDLKRRLRKLGREKEVEVLEVKLEELRERGEEAGRLDS